MYITPRSLRAVAYSTLAFSVAHASYVIDNLSFGCVHVWLPRPSIH
jgi:mannose-binding lectin 1